MIQATLDTYLFRLGQRPYIKTGILGGLLFGAFLLCALPLPSLASSSYLHIAMLYAVPQVAGCAGRALLVYQLYIFIGLCVDCALSPCVTYWLFKEMLV